MQNEHFVENLATPLMHSASVKTVYGEPIITEGKTIIPVAQIAIGFGGGFGQKARNKQKSLTDDVKEAVPNEEGAGGGGGMFAKAKGVYEITAQGTRFIPANNLKQLLLAALAGFLIKGWIMPKK